MCDNHCWRTHYEFGDSPATAQLSFLEQTMVEELEQEYAVLKDKVRELREYL